MIQITEIVYFKKKSNKNSEDPKQIIEKANEVIELSELNNFRKSKTLYGYDEFVNYTWLDNDEFNSTILNKKMTT